MTIATKTIQLDGSGRPLFAADNRLDVPLASAFMHTDANPPATPARALNPLEWHGPDDAIRDAQALAERLGFKRFTLAFQHFSAGAGLQRVAISSYPREWLALYEQHQYMNVDPILARAMNCSSPFGWDEVRATTPRERAFLRDAALYGLRNGLTIPLHSAGGELMILSLAGDQVPRNRDGRWRIYEPCYRFLAEASGPLKAMTSKAADAKPMQPLTPAQREVFIQLMRGKSLKDVARVLGLHIRAVEDRLARACHSLGAKSRSQALVRAVSSRQIQILEGDAVDNRDLRWMVHEPEAPDTPRRRMGEPPRHGT